MGHLVTDSRFLVANPYSSWARSIYPKGLLPFFEEKPWTVLRPRPEHGSGCPRRLCGQVPAASGPSLTTPHSKGALKQL